MQPLLLAATALFALAGWVWLLARPAADAGAAVAVPVAVIAALGAVALLARATLRGGGALGLLAAAVVLATDAAPRGSFGGDLDLQSVGKLALWCSGLVLAAWRWRELAAAARQPASGLIVAFALWGLLSALWSATPAYSAAAALGLLGVWATATLCAQRLPARASTAALAGGLVAAVAISLALGVLAPERALTAMEGGTIQRLSGLFASPNNLGRAAALLLLLMLLVLWAALSGPGRGPGSGSGGRVPSRRRLAVPALLTGAALASAALVQSESRAALGALLLGLAVALAPPLWRRARAAAWLAALALALLAGMAALALLSSATLRTLALDAVSRTGQLEELTSFTGRTDIWRAVVGLIGEAPWLGHGFASGREVLPAAFQGAWGWTTTSAHNQWLQAWMTTGAVGLALVLLAQAAWLRAAMTRPQPLRDGVMTFVLAVGVFEAGALGPSITLLTFAWCWAAALVPAATPARAPFVARGTPGAHGGAS
jgi:O-antigen ligase